MPLRLKARRLVALGAIGACLSPCNQAWGQTHPVPTQGAEAPIRLDQIQVIGSHNSYHAGLTAERLAEIAAVNPDLAALLDYRHASLTQQLDAGVRQIELDLYADDKGGRFARPHRPGRPEIVWPLAPSARAVMERPGIKVMHIPDLDQHATCLTLSTCLKEVTRWSQAHPPSHPDFHHSGNRTARRSARRHIGPAFHTPDIRRARCHHTRCDPCRQASDTR